LKIIEVEKVSGSVFLMTEESDSDVEEIKNFSFLEKKLEITKKKIWKFSAQGYQVLVDRFVLDSKMIDPGWCPMMKFRPKEYIYTTDGLINNTAKFADPVEKYL
jgi:hypothetical protein